MVTGRTPVPDDGHDRDADADTGEIKRLAGTVVGETPDASKGKQRKVWPFVLLLWVLSLVAVAFVSTRVGFDMGVKDHKREVAAAAEAQKKKDAERKPPQGMYCPDVGSAEYLGPKTLRDQPVVTIGQPPTEKVVVFRGGVVVLVKVRITVDIVICGNDASLVFYVPPAPSVRILMEGGTTKNAGPAIYMVDGITMPPAVQVWFSNNKPVVVLCYETRGPVGEMNRPCTSYYNPAPPAPGPTSSRR